MRVFKACRHAVFHSKLQGIDSQLLCDIVRLTLGKPNRLRNTVSSHRTCCRSIGIDRPAIHLRTEFILIQFLIDISAVGTNRMPVRSITAVVGKGFQLSCEELSVFRHHRLCVSRNLVSCSGSVNGFLSGNLKANGSTANLHGHISIQRLIEHILFISEASSDIGLNNANLSCGNPECHGSVKLYNMRNLGRAYNRYFSVDIHISKGNRKFDMTVGNLRRIIDRRKLYDIVLSVLRLRLLYPFFKGKILLHHGHMAMNDDIVLTEIRVQRSCPFL